MSPSPSPNRGRSASEVALANLHLDPTWERLSQQFTPTTTEASTSRAASAHFRGPLKESTTTTTTTPIWSGLEDDSDDLDYNCDYDCDDDYHHSLFPAIISDEDLDNLCPALEPSIVEEEEEEFAQKANLALHLMMIQSQEPHHYQPQQRDQRPSFSSTKSSSSTSSVLQEVFSPYYVSPPPDIDLEPSHEGTRGHYFTPHKQLYSDVPTYFARSFASSSSNSSCGEDEEEGYFPGSRSSRSSFSTPDSCYGEVISVTGSSSSPLSSSVDLVGQRSWNSSDMDVSGAAYSSRASQSPYPSLSQSTHQTQTQSSSPSLLPSLVTRRRGPGASSLLSLSTPTKPTTTTTTYEKGDGLVAEFFPSSPVLRTKKRSNTGYAF